LARERRLAACDHELASPHGLRDFSRSIVRGLTASASRCCAAVRVARAMQAEASGKIQRFCVPRITRFRVRLAVDGSAKWRESCRLNGSRLLACVMRKRRRIGPGGESGAVGEAARRVGATSSGRALARAASGQPRAPMNEPCRPKTLKFAQRTKIPSWSSCRVLSCVSR